MNCHHGFPNDMKCGYCCYEDIFDRKITVNKELKMSNEWGDGCYKCKNHVDPYAGETYAGETFCLDCFESIRIKRLDNLSIPSMVEINNKLDKVLETAYKIDNIKFGVPLGLQEFINQWKIVSEDLHLWLARIEAIENQIKELTV